MTALSECFVCDWCIRVFCVHINCACQADSAYSVSKIEFGREKFAHPNIIRV